MFIHIRISNIHSSLNVKLFLIKKKEEKVGIKFIDTKKSFEVTFVNNEGTNNTL